VISFTLFTRVIILVRHYKRALSPSEERRGNRFLSVVLTIFVLIAIITTVFVIVVLKKVERFSEFYIPGENRTAAEYVQTKITLCWCVIDNPIFSYLMMVTAERRS
jgi:uncharacterized membrane protein